MATAKQNNTVGKGLNRGLNRSGGLGRRLALGAGLVAVLVGALYWVPLRRAGLAGTAFGARIACSCRYVAGRALSDCRKDFEPGMALVMLDEDEEAHAITARIPVLARQTATFRPGQGCALERWDG